MPKKEKSRVNLLTFFLVLLKLHKPCCQVQHGDPSLVRLKPAQGLAPKVLLGAQNDLNCYTGEIGIDENDKKNSKNHF